MSHEISVVTPLSLETVLARTRAALVAEGFEVLSEIDVEAMLWDELGVEIEPHLVVEACTEARAPCNVVVRADENETVVEVLEPFPADARDRLVRVVAALAD